MLLGNLATGGLFQVDIPSPHEPRASTGNRRKHVKVLREHGRVVPGRDQAGIRGAGHPRYESLARKATHRSGPMIIAGESRHERGHCLGVARQRFGGD